MPHGIEKGNGWEPKDYDADEKHVSIPEYDNVLPMVWGTDKNSPEAVQRHLDQWDATSTSTPAGITKRDKILVSPNFGDAWYNYGRSHISVAVEWNKRNTDNSILGDNSLYCDANRMTTVLQNLMFVPTSLARELHRERRSIVLQEEDANNNNNNKDNGMLLPHQQTELRYGAIHLRMNILNRDVYKIGVTKEQVVAGLRDCLEGGIVTNEKHDDASTIQKWWLVADDVDVAAYVAAHLPNVYSYATKVLDDEGNNHEIPKNETAAIRQTIKGTHSGYAMRQPFGQADLAASVLDWMALHQSHLALITHDSAYGDTGARGSGKIQSTVTCGQVKNKRQSFPCFICIIKIMAYYS